MTRRTLYRTSTAIVAVAFVVTSSTLASFVFEGRPLWALIVLSVVALQWWLLCTNWRELRGMRHPIPPTDVQLMTDDGRIEAVQCVYRCFDGNVHRWEIITPDWFTYDYTTTHNIMIRCAVLPPHTAIDATTVKARPIE